MLVRIILVCFSMLAIIACGQGKNEISQINFTKYILNDDGCDKILKTYNLTFVSTELAVLLLSKNEEFYSELRRSEMSTFFFEGQNSKGRYTLYSNKISGIRNDDFEMVLRLVKKITNNKLPDMSVEEQSLLARYFPHQSDELATFSICKQHSFMLRENEDGDLRLFIAKKDGQLVGDIYF